MKFSEKFKERLKQLNLYDLIKTWYYKLDWRKPDMVLVNEFLEKNVNRARELVDDGTLPKFTGTQDQKMIKILQWVKSKIKYRSDKKRFGVAEKWQTVDESLGRWFIEIENKLHKVHEGFDKPIKYPNAFKCGDCEDGAILIHSIARANGISSYAVRLVAGWVANNGKKEGHCWIEYYPDEYLAKIPYTLDWCYWYDSSNFNKRIAKDKTKYLSNWFRVTA